MSLVETLRRTRREEDSDKSLLLRPAEVWATEWPWATFAALLVAIGMQVVMPSADAFAYVNAHRGQALGTPPGYVFAIVWAVLYAFMAAAISLWLRSRTMTRGDAALLTVNVVLNKAWSPVFLYEAAYASVAALFILIGIVATSVVLVVRMPHAEVRALWLAYGAWTCYALGLNLMWIPILYARY